MPVYFFRQAMRGSRPTEGRPDGRPASSNHYRVFFHEKTLIFFSSAHSIIGAARGPQPAPLIKRQQPSIPPVRRSSKCRRPPPAVSRPLSAGARRAERFPRARSSTRRAWSAGSFRTPPWTPTSSCSTAAAGRSIAPARCSTECPFRPCTLTTSSSRPPRQGRPWSSSPASSPRGCVPTGTPSPPWSAHVLSCGTRSLALCSMASLSGSGC